MLVEAIFAKWTKALVGWTGLEVAKADFLHAFLVAFDDDDLHGIGGLVEYGGGDDEAGDISTHWTELVDAGDGHICACVLGIAPGLETVETEDMRAAREEAVDGRFLETDRATLVIIVDAVRGSLGTLVEEPASVAVLAEACGRQRHVRRGGED